MQAIKMLLSMLEANLQSCPGQKQKNWDSGRSATSNRRLPRGRNCLDSTSSWIRPRNGSGGWVHSDFEEKTGPSGFLGFKKMSIRFLGFSPSHVPSSATLASPSSPLPWPSHSSLAPSSPALLLWGCSDRTGDNKI